MIPVWDFAITANWIWEAARETVKWLIIRAFVLSVVMVMVPFAIFKAWTMICKTFLEAVQAQGSAAGISAVIVNFTGLAAWLAECLKLPECFAALLTGLSTAFVIRIIKP